MRMEIDPKKSIFGAIGPDYTRKNEAVKIVNYFAEGEEP